MGGRSCADGEGLSGVDDVVSCAKAPALARSRRSARQRWPMLKDKPRRVQRRDGGGDGDGIIEVWVRLGTLIQPT